MGFELKLKYTPGEQRPHADALSRLDFNDDNNDRVCFALVKIYFLQSDLEIQSDVRTKLGLNGIFQVVIRRIENRKWKQCSDAENGIEQQKDALTILNRIIF